jgi:Sporulation and spore germination
VVRRSPIIGAIVIAGLVIAGCAIPTQGTPSAIPASHVPSGLLNPQLPTTTTTQPKAAVQVKIFLLGPNRRLVEETRVAPVPAPLKLVVIQLLGGPLQKEEREGISTAIPSSVHLISATLSNNPPLATVNFNQAFGEITGSSTELAVAQVVFTVVTASTLDTGVIFQIDGQTISVPMAGGGQVPSPVYLSQYLANGP